MNIVSHGVNLLPEKEKRSLRARYRTRFFSTLFFFMACAIFAGGILLLPPFLLTRADAAASSAYVQALERAVGVREDTDTRIEIALFSERVSILSEFAAPEHALAASAALLGLVPQGITIRSLAFSYAEGGGRVAVEGVASTRSALLAFSDALKESGQFGNTAVPVSQLAGDSDVPFSLTLTFIPPSL